MTMKYTERATALELHLNTNPDFTRKGWGRKVRELGGEFSEVRGRSETRFVTVPLSERGLRLVPELLIAFGKKAVTVVFRGGEKLPSWANVHRVKHGVEDPIGELLGKRERAVRQAYERGLAGS